VYTFPSQLRLGDEGQILIDITSLYSADQQLRIDIASDGLTIRPDSMEPMNIAGKTHTERRVIVSPRSIGNKAFILTPTLLPSHSAMPAGAGHIDVLPPVRILGIPQPYLELTRDLATAIGLPGLILALATLYLTRAKNAS
jgi:hypothetical protein